MFFVFYISTLNNHLLKVLIFLDLHPDESVFCILFTFESNFILENFGNIYLSSYITFLK